MLVQHHIKYKEIHGVDEIVMMTQSEHKKLHNRLRVEGKCTIPVDKLQKITSAAHQRTPKGRVTQLKSRTKYRQRIEFNTHMFPYMSLFERMEYNINSGEVYCSSGFRGNHGGTIIYINIPVT